MPKYTLFLIVLLAILAGCDAGQAATDSTPTAQPTSKPMQSSPQPRLGDVLSVFVARYGRSNDHSDAKRGTYHFAQYPSTSTDSIIATTDITDRGYDQRVMSIDAAAPDSGWTATQGRAICTGFFPSDAKYQRKVALSGMDYDEIYSSSSLVRLFPAGAFDDAMNQPTKAGLFDVHYSVGQDSTITACTVQIGTQQTQ